MDEADLQKRTVTKKSQQQQSCISNLRNPTRFITSQNLEGRAVIHSKTDYTWRAVDDDQTALSIVYSTSSFPVEVENDKDISAHEDLLDEGMGLVNPGGTVIRCVDFAPGYACPMHRTTSVDYGIVLEGEIEMLLDSGDVTTMKRGDVAVQRATQHQWINKSRTEWSRMMFVLQPCAVFEVAGRPVRDELGTVSPHKQVEIRDPDNDVAS